MARPKDMLNFFKPDAPVKKHNATKVGQAGFDNIRDNIDPHIKTQTLTTKEISSGATVLGDIEIQGTLSGGNIIHSAAGSNTDIQFNDGGDFSGASLLTWNGSTLDVDGDVSLVVGKKLIFNSDDGSDTYIIGTATGLDYYNQGTHIITQTGATISMKALTRHSGILVMEDNQRIYLGTGTDASIIWGVLAGGEVDRLYIGMGNTSKHLIMGTTGNSGGSGRYLHGNQKDPTIYVHSNQPSTATTTEWLSLSHTSGANALIATGGADLELSGAAVGIGTATPAEKLEVAGNFLLSGANGILYLPNLKKINGTTPAADGDALKFEIGTGRIYGG